jgi:uncharacterized protein
MKPRYTNEVEPASMKLLNILPKEEKFYDLLESLAHCAHQASHALHQWVQQPEEQQGASHCPKEITEAKNKANALLSTTTKEVCQTFITPFDREDIQELANTLYLIPKVIDKVRSRMLRHHIQPSRNDMSRFSHLIVRQADQFEALLKGLVKGQHANLIHEKAAVVYELEDQGDETFSLLLEELFSEQRDARELILRKDLYELLEDVTDCYRDAAGVCLRIVLKHS